MNDVMASGGLAFQRTLFEPDHDDYRDAVRRFIANEVETRHAAWEAEGAVPRELWELAGNSGHLCHAAPIEYGGAGVDDFRFPVVLNEELSYALATGPGFSLHSDIVMPYILTLGTEEQRARWLPGMVAGTRIGAIAMTEPGAGSDLAGIRTTAVRDGGSYVVNGGKTFITNGQLADLIIVVARTDDHPHKGLTLFVLERGMPGLDRGRNLEKIGLKAQDTSELFFQDVRVPVENRLGEEGAGFAHLMRNLPQERLLIATSAVAASRRMLDLTVEYVRGRKAFGSTIGNLQHTKFALAQIATELELAQALHDRCIEADARGELTAEQAAMAKWWCSDMQFRTADTCLQLHGGYGYMAEYPIARAFLDARVQRIYGGTNEVMKEIIGRALCC